MTTILSSSPWSRRHFLPLGLAFLVSAFLEIPASHGAEPSTPSAAADALPDPPRAPDDNNNDKFDVEIDPANKADSRGWQELTVWLPNPRDVVSVLGCGSTLASSLNGSKDYRVLLPRGAWVEIIVSSADEPGIYLRHLVPYRGAREWTVTSDDRRLYVARDDQPPRIVGVSPPADQPERFLRGVERNQLDREICVQLPGRTLIDGVRDLGPGRVTAYTTTQEFDAQSLASLAWEKPKALALTLAGADLNGIGIFQKLEALNLTAKWPPARGLKRGVDHFPTDDLVFNSFPIVTDLELTNIPFHEALSDFLTRPHQLRMLDCRWTMSDSNTLWDKPRWDSVGDLSASLESLRMGPGLDAPAAAVGQLRELRLLTLSPTSKAELESDPFQPEALNALLALECISSGVDTDRLAAALAAGQLRALRRISGLRRFQPGTLPQLDTLWLSPPAVGETETQPIESLADQKGLRVLSLGGTTQGDLEQLATYPCARTVQHLHLTAGTLDDLSPLSRFSRLQRLTLQGTTQGIDTLDVATLPTLTRLILFREANLLSIEGLMDHPALNSLSIRDCAGLTSLGSPASNTVLESIELARCPKVTGLDTLSRTRALTHVEFLDCASLDGSLDFLKSNPLRSLTIRGCPHLKNLSLRNLRK